MKTKSLLASFMAAALLAATIVPTVAEAAPRRHKHKVCNVDRHHHRSCHWVR